MALRTLSLLITCLVLTSLAFAQKVPRSVKPEDLEKYWVMMKSSVEGNAPLGGKNMEQSGCAAVSFIVEGNGRTSNITIEKVEPPGGLGELAASIASHLEFEPTIINAGRDRVFSSLIFPFNLPPDPEGKDYQLWAIAGGKPVSAGVFSVSAEGSALVPLLQFPTQGSVAAFAVTLEPAGGVPQPSGDMVLIGTIGG